MGFREFSKLGSLSTGVLFIRVPYYLWGPKEGTLL